MQHPDERLDLVDDQDRVIGQARRSEVYRAGRVNFRVVNAFLANAAGQLWIPRRSATKRLFPLGLDVSMGGHVASGETYEDALRRELREELNPDLDRQARRCLAYLSPYGKPLSAFMKVFPNARLCKALLDRITDRAHIIDTGTDSYRFKRTLTSRQQRPEQRVHQSSPST